MKTLLLTLFVLLICSGSLVAQNSPNENPTQIGFNLIGQLYFNQDTTAIVGNKAMVEDIGYEYVKKTDVTTSIRSIDVNDLQNGGYYNGNSISEYLHMHFPRYSGNELIVIDGQPGGSLDDITPSVIKSIQLLKGASATIYGMRGFYGVLVIDTK